MSERPGTREQRVEVRRPCRDKSCRLLEPGGHESRWARLQDVSQHGLALILNSGLTPGTFLTIEVRTPSRRGSCTLLARVVHATARPDGAWTIGCALVQPLSDDVLQELV
jgi:hypothetical protein